MFCTKCRKENADDARFCNRCGCSINQSSAKDDSLRKMMVPVIISIILLLALVLILLHEKKELIDAAEPIATTVIETTLEETTYELETEVVLEEERAVSPFPGKLPDEKSNGVSPAEYLLSESDSRVYAMKELNLLSEEQMRLARNEIFARHGRKFSSKDLQTYFSAQSWYTPIYEASAFDALGDTIFNEFEIGNLNLILELESAKEAAARPIVNTILKQYNIQRISVNSTPDTKLEEKSSYDILTNCYIINYEAVNHGEREQGLDIYFDKNFIICWKQNEKDHYFSLKELISIFESTDSFTLQEIETDTNGYITKAMIDGRSG